MAKVYERLAESVALQPGESLASRNEARESENGQRGPVAEHGASAR